MFSLFISFTLLFNSSLALHQMRDLFPLIGVNEQSNIQMILIATNNQQIALPIQKAYLASAKMASAKFKMFPMAKYQAFVEGKKLLEESVNQDFNNPEIRFVRYVIQSNLPPFLFYNQNMNNDKALIMQALPSIKVSDPDLYQRIVGYFGKN